MLLTIRCKLFGDLKNPGLKPMIWRLVTQTNLSGFIMDSPDDDSVILELTGDGEKIKAFIRPLPGELAPHSNLKNVTVVGRREHDEREDLPRGFKVIVPEDYPIPEIRPDTAPSKACIQDMLDRNNRRYSYPFWVGSDSGPGYSTMLFNPPMRKNTVFSSFPPCRKCQEDAAGGPAHLAGSHMLACRECGPHVFLCGPDGEFQSDVHPISKTQLALTQGKIVAMQYMFGGFQIFADATNRDALQQLRRKKGISDWPLALMARNVEAVKRIFKCSPMEEQLLTSPAAPIVLLQVKDGMKDYLPFDLIAPFSSVVPVVLPGSMQGILLFEHYGILNEQSKPLEYLALRTMNWDERSAKNDIDELMHCLKGKVDLFLCHDLKVAFDEPVSITAVRDNHPLMILRSRGYVPTPVKSPVSLKRKIAAFGTDQNATIALATGESVFPSQFIGNVIATREGATRLSAMMEHYISLFDTVPDAVACDANPNLFSSQEAAAFAKKYSLPLIPVDVPHAYALSAMMEHNLDSALAIVFTNGKLCEDNTYWGADLLEVTREGFTKLGSFETTCLPGSFESVNTPEKQLFARFIQGGVPVSQELLEYYGVSQEEVDVWRRAMNAKQPGTYCMAHSAERLFDAVAAGMRVTPKVLTFSGLSNFLLANYARQAVGGIQAIPQWMYAKFTFSTSVTMKRQMIIDWNPLFANFSDPHWITPENIPQLSLAFHVKLADAIDSLADYGRLLTGINKVILTGSTFENGVLFELALGKLRSEKFNVYYPQKLPMNESCLCVGQAYFAGIAKQR